MRRQVTGNQELLELLDRLLSRGAIDWKTFYQDHGAKVPFFDNQPDENLVCWASSCLAAPGRCLDVGCGAGRNSIWLAERGWRVDAVDISTSALDWARQRSGHLGSKIRFHLVSIFDYAVAPGSYDLIYDSGCFHHLAPHRRESYCTLVQNALNPNGLFGLTCFNDRGGAPNADTEVYENWRMFGGLAYTDAELRAIFSSRFDFLELRGMRQTTKAEGLFGADFLWVALLRPRRAA